MQGPRAAAEMASWGGKRLPGKGQVVPGSPTRGPLRAAPTRGDAEEPGRAGTWWLSETAVVAGDINAVKQIKMPPDGIARCYWWRHLEDERGFLTDQPPDPDGWQLRTSDLGIFYELWDSADRQDPRLAPGAGQAAPLQNQPAHSI